MNTEAVKEKFKRMRTAYQHLFWGSVELLELDSLFWTEKILLKLVNLLSQKRIQNLKGILPPEPTDGENTIFRANMLEALISAALGGHPLGEWEEVEDNRGFQATCSACDGSVFVSASTLYSSMLDTCPAQAHDSPDDQW